MYLYKQNNQWKSIDNYCFIKPIHSLSKFDTEAKSYMNDMNLNAENL